MSYVTIAADDLNAAAEFDCPFTVNEAGQVELHTEFSAPSVWIIENSTGPVDTEVDDDAWTLLRGFTGQYGYRGPIMHESERLGGRIAEYILSTPGTYAVVEVRDYNGEYDDESPVGWAVAYRPTV